MNEGKAMVESASSTNLTILAELVHVIYNKFIKDEYDRQKSVKEEKIKH